MHYPERESTQSYHYHKEIRGIKVVATQLDILAKGMRCEIALVLHLQDPRLVNQSRASTLTKQCVFGKAGGRPLCHLIALHHLNTIRARPKEIPLTGNRLQWGWDQRIILLSLPQLPPLLYGANAFQRPCPGWHNSGLTF